MFYGIIDLGSNTVKLCIYKVDNGQFKTSYVQKETIGLISFVDENNELSKEGIKRAIETIELLKNVSKKKRVSKLFIIATAVIRNINNSVLVLNELVSKTKMNIDLLSGNDEARAGFFGANAKYDFTDGIVIDIGGGSTEVVIYQSSTIVNTYSIPFGSLNIFINYVNNLIPTKKEIKNIEQVIKDEVKKLDLINQDITTAYGIGGTINSTLKLKKNYFVDDNDNNKMVSTQIKKLINYVDHKDKRTYLEFIRLVPDRIHTILPGMIILKVILKSLNIKEMFVSDYGIREGYLKTKLLEQSR